MLETERKGAASTVARISPERSAYGERADIMLALCLRSEEIPMRFRSHRVIPSKREPRLYASISPTCVVETVVVE